MKRTLGALAFWFCGATTGLAEEALRVCLNENAPPYSQRDGDGGFDMAVAKALAAKLGRTLEVQWYESKLDEDSSGALEANALLSDGRCRLVAGYPLNEDALAKPGLPTGRLPEFEGFKPARDRKRRVTLGLLQPSKAYHAAALTIIVGGVAAGRPVAGLGDLAGIKIGVEGGTLSDTILMTYGGGKLIDEITHFVPGRDELWSKLESGAVDATLAPMHRFDAYRAKQPNTGLKASGYLFPLRFNFGFAGLQSDAAFMSEVDTALGQMLTSGEIKHLAPKAGMTYLAPSQPDVGKRIVMSDLKVD
jgi:ABC-type amino acid transport substrate-binding protein